MKKKSCWLFTGHRNWTRRADDSGSNGTWVPGYFPARGCAHLRVHFEWKALDWDDVALLPVITAILYRLHCQNGTRLFKAIVSPDYAHQELILISGRSSVLGTTDNQKKLAARVVCRHRAITTFKLGDNWGFWSSEIKWHTSERLFRYTSCQIKGPSAWPPDRRLIPKFYRIWPQWFTQPRIFGASPAQQNLCQYQREPLERHNIFN